MLKYSFELDAFQKEAFNHIKKNNNILVTAHTGSGKTVIAEYAISYNIQQNSQKRIFYVSPIKSLSNEKYKDFKKIFEPTGISIGILTGDHKICPDAMVVIMTAEILRNDLYIHKKLADNVSCIIFDEIHYINDQDRGTVWEEILMILDPKIQLVLLSATIQNPMKFINWLYQLKNVDFHLITTPLRIVPLTNSVLVNQETFILTDNTNIFQEKIYYQLIKEATPINVKDKNVINTLTSILHYLMSKKLFQTIFFIFSRVKCEEFANSISLCLTTSEEQVQIERMFNFHLRDYRKTYEKIHQYQNLLDLMKKGIAYHHSGLIPILKEIVEIIFKKGLVKILFATETFCVGVNMPTKSVVFLELEKYTKNGKRLLTPSEYKQMSGRAGRRGIDTKGYVFIAPLHQIPSKKDLQYVLTGRIDEIHSNLNISYSLLLHLIFSEENIIDYINKSFHNVEVKKNIIDSKQELDNLYLNITLFEKQFTEEDICLFEKLCSFQDLQNNNIGIKIKLSKTQEKELSNIKQQLRSRNLQNKHDDFIKYKKTQTDIVYLQNKIKNNPILENINKIFEFLKNCEYIKKDIVFDCQFKKDFLTQKGTLSTYINDCNALILTEIIHQKIFHDLKIQEIIAILSIFIDEHIEESDYICTSSKVNETLQKIKQIVSDLQQKEITYKIHTNFDYWTIRTEFIDIAYMWASQCSFGEIKEYLIKNSRSEIYEGNFIKNLLKINNIINSLVETLELYQDYEIISILQQGSTLIIRDFVSANSLYL